MISRVALLSGDKRGKRGYADIPDERPEGRYAGVWVTLDPQPSVTFGDKGSIAARPVTVWVLYRDLSVMTLMDLLAEPMLGRCECGHAGQVHFGGRCMMPMTDMSCPCTSFREKEEE